MSAVCTMVTPIGSRTGACTNGGVGLVVDTSATMGALSSSSASCVDNGSDEQALSGLIGLVSCVDAMVDVARGRVCAATVQGYRPQH